MTSAALLAAAIASSAGISPGTFNAIAEDVKREPRFHPRNAGIRFLTCAICGNGGGTLLNDGSKKRKTHKRCRNGA